MYLQLDGEMKSYETLFLKILNGLLSCTFFPCYAFYFIPYPLMTLLSLLSWVYFYPPFGDDCISKLCSCRPICIEALNFTISLYTYNFAQKTLHIPHKFDTIHHNNFYCHEEKNPPLWNENGRTNRALLSNVSSRIRNIRRVAATPEVLRGPLKCVCSNHIWSLLHTSVLCLSNFPSCIVMIRTLFTISVMFLNKIVSWVQPFFCVWVALSLTFTRRVKRNSIHVAEWCREVNQALKKIYKLSKHFC